MDFDVNELIKLISNYIWPLVRVSGFVISVPVISSASVPAKVRLGFVVYLTFIISLTAKNLPGFEFFSLHSVIYILYEFLLGIMMGFIIQLVFQAFILGGQVVAMQTGLGFATLVDPSSKASVPLIAQLYLMLISLVFLVLNGHLILIDLLVKSFEYQPIGRIHGFENALWQLLLFFAWVYKGAVLLALPAIIALLTVNISFGVMMRAAPQLNIFAVGFPITLNLGMLIIFISLYSVLPHINKLLNEGLLLIKGMMT